VIDSVRSSMDPFYSYRRRNGGSVLSKEQIERSARDDDRFDMRSSARLLRYDRTAFCPVCLVPYHIIPYSITTAYRTGCYGYCWHTIY
jgi:hypothetical protein